MNVKYKNIVCSKMSEKEIEETSRLFSENYGTWSLACGDDRANQPIKFTKKMIRSCFVEKEDCNVVLAYYDNELVGHIFYVKRKGRGFDYVIWVLQLVVKKEYRGNRIGSKMMQSIWKLSNSFACGLYTSNPMTIKTLEKATLRKVNVKMIDKNIEKLKSISYDFLKDTNWIDTYSAGVVNTRFFTDHKDLQEKIKKAYPNGDFPMDPNLPEGCEWLAFVFMSQQPSIENIDELNDYLEFSEDILVSAYSKMNMDSQSWASHTDQEIDYIEKKFDGVKNVLDLGCGIGRHSIELAQRGYNVTGIDFSERNIKMANEKSKNITNANFICADARKYKSKEKYDAVICLYDVIGSFPDEKENLKIIKTAYKCLKKDGILILSVLNMSLTRKLIRTKNIVDGIEKNLDKLLKLSGNDIMQKTGNIFDGKLMMLDDQTGIIYRKEQFFDEESLPIEYIVRDRRYTLSGISRLTQKAGFNIMQNSHVQSGRFSKPLEPTSKNAKEILLIAKKSSVPYAFLQKFVNIKNTWK